MKVSMTIVTRYDRRLEFTEAAMQANTSSQQSVVREVDSSHNATEDPEDILQRTVRNELDSSKNHVIVPRLSSAARDCELASGLTSPSHNPDASAPHRSDTSALYHRDVLAPSREETSPIPRKIQHDVGSVMPLSSLSPVQNDYAHSSSVRCFESSFGPGVAISVVPTGKNFSNITSRDEFTKNVEHKKPKRNSDTKAQLHVSRKGDKLAKK
jgi:hypothetical protein